MYLIFTGDCQVFYINLFLCCTREKYLINTRVVHSTENSYYSSVGTHPQAIFPDCETGTKGMCIHVWYLYLRYKIELVS